MGAIFILHRKPDLTASRWMRAQYSFSRRHDVL
jgi:hypothetical protein